jgi:hypothetical protein
MAAQSKLATDATDASLAQLRMTLAAGIPRPLKLIGLSAAAVAGIVYLVRHIRQPAVTEEESRLQRGSMFVIRLQRIIRILIPGYATKEFIYLSILSLLLIGMSHAK